ncbi:alpha/beta hydrolase [Amycolatopsis nigrescens]|uniref:alpha/beta hydrolase n=1 Tax=Amycolatopsis nigrescens TaxID=381445 RepID=UPI00036230A2|nr:alpha/beta hydrolase [Amycolatopsis nigrescens]
MDPELRVAAAAFPPDDLSDIAAARRRNREFEESVRPDTAGQLLDVHDLSADGVPIRVYAPAGPPRRRPVLVWFHGGAFVLGGLATDDPRCSRLAVHADALVVAVDYRLAPEHPAPAALEDCYRALTWVAGHLALLGGCVRRLAVAGASAGGGLAAGTALLARDRGGPPIVFQHLLYPALDDRLLTRSSRESAGVPVFDSNSAVAMWRHYLAGQPATPYLAPARMADLAGLPPAYLVTAEHDPLRDEGIEYATRLLAAGVACELHVVPGAFHAFDTFAPNAAVSRNADLEYGRVLSDAFRIAGGVPEPMPAGA